MGELAERRHPVLVALVFGFALFLAAVPFLFRYERSYYAEALTLYERACAALAANDQRGLLEVLSTNTLARGGLSSIFAASRLTCVDRRLARATLEPHGDLSENRVYILTLYPPSGSQPIVFRVIEEGDNLRWWPQTEP